jgi:Flp pilus assembly protein TadD
MADLTAQQCFDLAVQHHRRGQLRQAGELYQRILVRQPRHVDALHMLGVIAAQEGRAAAAVELIGQAVALAPNIPEVLGNFANALHAHGEVDRAIEMYRRSILLKPGDAQTHSGLANALITRGLLAEAIVACQKAISLNANLAEAHCNLGNALLDSGHLCEAMSACQCAIALDPQLAEAHCNFGNVLTDMGKADEALPCYQRAIALRGDFAEAHRNLGLALLALGDFTPGWIEMQWQARCKDASPRCRDIPLWDGGDLHGRSILLHEEQGIGDTIQFARYLPMVAGCGGRVVLECAPELIGLLGTMVGEFEVVIARAVPPAVAVHCPLMSLPRIFHTTLESIPAEAPYLRPDPADVQWWGARLGSESGLKVGVVWAGNPQHKNDRNRSMSPTELAPLAQVAGVRFVNLQKGGNSRLPDEMNALEAMDDIRDVADTAALIANLDLVISVDTSVAHLAGAMGKATWTLLPFVAEWRWLRDRCDSPWYPTMRLFRQKSPGDWSGVIREAADALAALVRDRAISGS